MLAEATYDREAKNADYAKIRHLQLEQLGFDENTTITLAVFLWTFFYSASDEHLLWPGGSLEDTCLTLTLDARRSRCRCNRETHFAFYVT